MHKTIYVSVSIQCFVSSQIQHSISVSKWPMSLGKWVTYFITKVRWINDLHAKNKTMKLLEENKSDYLFNIFWR